MWPNGMKQEAHTISKWQAFKRKPSAYKLEILSSVSISSRFNCKAASKVCPKLMNQRNDMDDGAKNSICQNSMRRCGHKTSMHRIKAQRYYAQPRTNVNTK